MSVSVGGCLQVYTGSYVIDGCATFYRRDRFSLVKKYEVWLHFSRTRIALPVFPPSAA